MRFNEITCKGSRGIRESLAKKSGMAEEKNLPRGKYIPSQTTANILRMEEGLKS